MDIPDALQSFVENLVMIDVVIFQAFLTKPGADLSHGQMHTYIVTWFKLFKLEIRIHVMESALPNRRMGTAVI